MLFVPGIFALHYVSEIHSCCCIVSSANHRSDLGLVFRNRKPAATEDSFMEEVVFVFVLLVYFRTI